MFYIQEFWATCACPEKLRVPWIHSAEYTFNYSGFLSYLCLPWKTELPRYVSLYGIYFLHSEFLSNLHALALKNRVALIFFTVLNLLFTFRIFEQLVLALKKKVPWNLSLCGIYSRICLIRHLKGIRKKWRIRRSDELGKQVKTLP